jgi:DNA-binding NtrC family response regulator
MSLSAQARLLRVLQERCLQRVGGTKTIALDARVLSSSNRDLTQLVSEGRFRQDLYYRLVVFPIELPPLRRRREDIPALVEHFLAKYAGDAGRRITRVEPDALELLMRHDWPGNVRELENVIHRSLLVASAPELKRDDLPRELAAEQGGAAGADNGPGELRSLEELERQAIESAIAHFGGNLSDVARQLGIGRSTLYRKLEQYGLRPTKNED